MIGALTRKWVSEKFLLPLGKRLGFLNPNHITLLTYPLVVAAAYFITQRDFVLALVFSILSTIVDNIDGAVAKANNKKTLFGSYLDAMTDKVQEIILLAAVGSLGYWMEAFLALAATFLVSYAKPRAEMLKPLNNLDAPSIGERAERLLLLFAALALATFSPTFLGQDVFLLYLYSLTAISAVGAVQRFFFYKEILSS